MKCIGCKRNVGTIFSNKNNTYSAVCGDKEDACPLDISLKRGIYVHLPTEIAMIQKDHPRCRNQYYIHKIRFIIWIY